MSLNRNPKRIGRPPLDLSGQRFGLLTALQRVSYAAPVGLPTLWLCRCDCGVENMVRMTDLRSGRSRSCGCLRRALFKARVLPREENGRFVAT